MTKSLFGGYCKTVFHVVKSKIIRHINIFLHVETLVQIQISPNMSKMVQTVQMVPMVQMVQNGPKRSKTVQNGPNGPKRSKMVQNGPNGPKRSKRSKMVQNGPNGPKCKNGPKLSDMVQNGPNFPYAFPILKFQKDTFFWDTLYRVGVYGADSCIRNMKLARGKSSP